MITPTDIEAAAARIAPHVRVTPTLALEPGAFDAARVQLKLELLQHSGSFKPRGAFNRILSGDLTDAGVIAASGGNHGAAVAYAARRLGTRAEIFVPATTPAIKLARLKSYGATVHALGQDYAEAFLAMKLRAQQTGALLVHAYDQAEVVAGQGTAAREFQQQVGALDTVLVAVGGGGFIGGIAAWYRGDARVVGVESTGTPTLARALEANEIVEVAVSGLAADALGARRIGAIAFDLARRYVEHVILVTDDEIQAAQRWLWEHCRIVAEPGGATAFAALLARKFCAHGGERVGVMICGGNTDPGNLTQAP
jgi:threonine dehydratase